MIELGQPAPDFALESDTGDTIRLSDLRGGPVVVYFYPKDETPGCTTQACDIRDSWGEFEHAGASVLGISPDSAEAHAGFRAHHKLPFPLLVDSDHAVAEAYGAWREKTNYGKTYMGIGRSSFLVDPEGRIAKTWANVKADGHADEVKAALESAVAGHPA